MKLKQKLFYATLGFLAGNALLLLAIWGFSFLSNTSSASEEIALNQALTKIKNNEIIKVNIDVDKATLTQKDDKAFFVTIDSSDASREVILKEAESANVQTVKIEPQGSSWFWLVLLNMVPFVFVIAIIGLLVGIFIRLGKNKTM